jgi:hypothetical protein
MKRKTLIRIHITATIVAVVTISSFFTCSLVAEIKGDETFIKNVKEAILFSQPLLIIVMPVLRIAGNQLAGKSQNPIILAKRKRINIVLVNGIALMTLACFLYYRLRYQAIDRVFLTA